MGDDHVGRRVPAQEAGQPADRLDVEVVRGLVEEQQVPRRGEERGQRDPAALPAGQPPGLPVQVQAAEQGAGHLAGPRVRGPGVLGHARAEDQVTDPAVKLVGLREVAEAQPARVGDPAGVQLAVAVPGGPGQSGPGQGGQQGGLAGPVPPDNANAVPVGHPERHLVQQYPGAERLGRRLQVDQVHAGSMVTRAPRR